MTAPTLTDRELDAKVAAVMGWTDIRNPSRPSAMGTMPDADGDRRMIPDFCADPRPLKAWLVAQEDVDCWSVGWDSGRSTNLAPWCRAWVHVGTHPDVRAITDQASTEGRALCLAVLSAFPGDDA